MRTHEKIEVEEWEVVLWPNFLVFGGHEVADKGCPVEAILLEDNSAAVVAHHEIETSEEFF